MKIHMACEIFYPPKAEVKFSLTAQCKDESYLYIDKDYKASHDKDQAGLRANATTVIQVGDLILKSFIP